MSCLGIPMIHEPETKDGFFLQVLRTIEDAESDMIREYQEEHSEEELYSLCGEDSLGSRE